MKGRYITIPVLSLLLTFGAVTLGKKMADKKIEPLRSHINIVEYMVQKNDRLENLAKEWIPNEIREKYSYNNGGDIPYLYLMELNSRTSSQLQIGETLKRPVYKTYNGI